MEHLVRHQVRVPDQDETGEHDDGLGHDRDRADDLVEVGRNLDAADVQPDEEHNPGERFEQPEPLEVDWPQRRREVGDVVAERDPGQEVVEVAERDHGEERDVDGVIENEGGAGHQPGDVAQSPEREILAATGERVGRGKLRIAQPDQRKHDPRREECERSQPQGRQGDDPQRGIDVGADGGVPPHVRPPDRYVAP